MGKKRAAAAAVSATAVPFPAPAAGLETEPDHFSDYGFDPQLLRFFSQPEVKRQWGRRQRHQQQQPAQLKPLESARFKLQKPITKKHHHHHLQKQQQRRRWWSSAASAALRLFKKRASSSTRPAAAAPTTPPYGSAAASATVPLYLADYDAAGWDDGGGDAAACTCWAPAVRSGSRLAAAEIGAAAVAVPYVSLRSTSGLAGGGTGGAPVMPIYLVT